MFKNKKIFIAAEIFPPTIGGPATYVFSLANSLHVHGWNVKILCYGKPDKMVLNKGIKINWVSNEWPLPIKYFFYFKKLFLFSWGYKIIYAMGPVASGLPAILLKKITGKKVIIKVVGDYAWEQAINTGQTELLIDEFQNKKFGGKINQLQKIEKWVCQKANVIITPSEYLKKIVSGWGADEDKIKVIYNAFIKGENEKVKKEKGLIISAGRMVLWKGFELLIKAVNELINDGCDLTLKILFGNGDPNYENQIKKLTTNNISIISLPHNEFLKILSSAEIFVLNTGYEGLSHTLLEVMAVGTPVITTSVGGNPELIQSGENGILIEYNNERQLKEAILSLHNNYEQKEKFVANSKKILEKFTFEKMINQTILALEML